MNWPVVGWPTQTEFRPSAYPNSSPRSDNMQAGVGWPGSLQPNFGRRLVMRTSLADILWRAVAWSPQLRQFCAVASSGTGNRCAVSSDGKMWGTVTTLPDNSWRGICWSPELRIYCAVAGSGTGNRFATSRNGTEWSTFSGAGDFTWAAICWSSELLLFCAVSNDGRIATSADGTNWTVRFTFGSDFIDVIWAAQAMVFCAIKNTFGTSYVSSNGATWTTGTNNSNMTNTQRVVYLPNVRLFLSLQSSSNITFISTDGLAWQQLTITSPGMFFGIYLAELQTLFCYNQGTQMTLTRDGRNFTIVSNPSQSLPQCRGFAYAPELKMIVGVGLSGTEDRLITTP